jgi:hypothetical protein
MRIAWDLLRGLAIWPVARSLAGALAPWRGWPERVRMVFRRRRWYRCEGCRRLCHVDYTPAVYWAARNPAGEATVAGTCRRCNPNPYGPGAGE